MGNLETALKNALAKGDIADSAFRKKVYESAANALQRSLASNPNVTEAAAQAQKERLANAIRAVEMETRASLTPAPAAKPVAQPDAEVRVKPEPVFEEAPDLDEDRDTDLHRGDLHVEPRHVERPQAEPSIADDRKRDPKSKVQAKRGPFALGLTVTILIAGLIAALLWIITSGAFVPEDQRDTSVPNPPAVLEGESSENLDPGTADAPETRAEAGQGWITIFTPQDPTVLGLSGGASADVQSDPFGDYARLTSPEGSEIEIDFPPGAVQALAGKPAQIAIEARADNGENVQMSVTCDFGAGIDCARMRYNLGQAPGEFIYRVDLTQNAPNGGGVLKLVADLEGQGRAVNLLTVRARAEPAN